MPDARITYTPNLALTKLPANYHVWAQIMNDNLTMLDAAVSGFVVYDNWRGAWTNSTHYALGDTVVDLVTAVIWTAQVAHTSTSIPTTFTQEQINHPTYWTLANAPAVKRGAWMPNTPYSVNDFVLANGVKYSMCLVQHVSSTSFEADLALGFWSVLIDFTTAGAQVPVGSTPPALPVTNSMWWNSDLGQLFVWYNDGNSTQWVPATPSSVIISNVRSFGAIGDGVTDDTAALNAAFAGASGHLVIVPPGTYKFTSLSIPNNVTMTALGAVFRSSGTFNNITVSSITIGTDCTIDELHYSTPTGEVHKSPIYLGARTRIEYVNLEADVQMAGEGVMTQGQDVEIGFLNSLRFDRPMLVDNDSGTQTTGFKLGGAYINSYVRGIRLTDTASYTIGSTHMEVASPNAAVTPGHNGFLLTGAPNGNIGDAYIADSGEHAFRIGGSVSTARLTKDVTIGTLTILRSGGCALKINPTTLMSVGVTETASNISVAGVRGIDIGKSNVGAGNMELLRISHARNVTIGWAFADKEQFAISCQYALQANDTSGLWIGSLGCRNSNGVIIFDQTSDADGATIFGGNVTNVHIGELFCDPGTGSNLIATAMANFVIGNIMITGLDVTTLNTRLLQVNGAQVFNGPFYIAGRIGGSVTPLYSGVDDPQVTYNIVFGNAQIIGRPTSGKYSSRQEVVGDVLDISNVPPTEPFVSAPYGVSALNAYGPGFSLSRVGSSRRGASIAAKQTGASGFNTGLAVIVGGTATATDAVREAAVFDHFLALKLNGALLTGAPVTKTASFTWNSLDNDIIVNNASAITTVTLPTASAWTGWKIGLTNYSAAFTVISASANVVPKTGAAAATAILPATAGAWAELKSDGTNWIILRSGT